MTKRKRIYITKSVILNLCLILAAFIVSYPLIYSVLAATNSQVEFLDVRLLPIPRTFQWSRLKNFTYILGLSEIWTAVFVTMLKFGAGTLIAIVTSAIGGFLFACVRFKGKNSVFFYYMFSMMIPGISLMVPTYVLFARLPLMGGNNILGQGGSGFINDVSFLFVTGWVGVYNIFLMRQIILTIGPELKEAASADGAGILRIIFRIYLPLCLPILAVLIIGGFIGTWNDYMTSLIYLPDRPEFQLIGTRIVFFMEVLGFGGYSGIPNYPFVFGMSVIYMLPPVVIFLIFQRQFISGLTAGSLKG